MSEQGKYPKNTYVERTVEERKSEVKIIINKLIELELTMSFPAVKELYKIMNTYIADGQTVKINIDFPEFSRKIRGVLHNSAREPCWIKLEKN